MVLNCFKFVPYRNQYKKIINIMYTYASTTIFFNTQIFLLFIIVLNSNLLVYLASRVSDFEIYPIITKTGHHNKDGGYSSITKTDAKQAP